MGTEEQRKFAVVRWTEGDDHGRLSEVKIDAIKGYDPLKIDQDGKPIGGEYEAMVEWRRGKKPKAGYPLYKGNIMHVAVTRFESACTMNLLLNDDVNDDVLAEDTQILSQSLLQVKKSNVPPKKDKAREFIEMYGSSQTKVNSSEPNNTSLKRELKLLKEENESLKRQLLEEVPELLQEMKKFVAIATTTLQRPPSLPYQPISPPPGSPPQSRSLPCPTSRGSPPRSSDAGNITEKPPAPSMSSTVEIQPGSGVFVNRLKWAYALNASKATVFVRQLLTAVFPEDTLLVSNLRGGNSRESLDLHKVEAIYGATLQKFPDTPPILIGNAINGKINELRNKQKKGVSK